MGYNVFSLCTLFCVWKIVSTETELHPNIVFIVADDLVRKSLNKCLSEKEKSKRPVNLVMFHCWGWNDVSFHGSDQVLTPNIDLLAYSGVALGRYYTHCVCTPSRSALLTGKYAYTLGMQGYPLTNGEDRGLPITEKILPQYLKEHGYATHLVGKWHVGLSRTEYLPTNRGFDTYFGHRGGYVDYYQYILEETWQNSIESGFDLFRNKTPSFDTEGYLTDVYNEEAKTVIRNHDTSRPLFLLLTHQAPHSGNDGALLQAPADYVRQIKHVPLFHRRMYAAMVQKLDDSIGDVIEALNVKGILQNTLVVFISDNGGMTTGDSLNYASNYPLRGLKMTPYEGGIRVAGLIWSANMNLSHNLWSGYMHVIDWIPTILKAAGFEPPTNIDGRDLWQNIIENKVSDRDEVFEIDDYTGFSAVISGDYKLVTGKPNPQYSSHLAGDLRVVNESKVSYTKTLRDSKVYYILHDIGKKFDMNKLNLRNQIKINCNADGELCTPGIGKSCLYNIKEDPCECKDLSTAHPDIVTRLEARLNQELERLVPRKVPLFRDPRASPLLHNNTWATWADGLDNRVREVKVNKEF